MRMGVLVGVLVAGAIGGAMATGGLTLDTVDDVVERAVEAGEDATAADGDGLDWGPGSSGGESGTPGAEELNETQVELLVHQEINEVRGEHGLSTLEFDHRLRKIAEYHSTDMAENGYFAHESPQGETMTDRYELFDYECQAWRGDGSYSTGSENIAKTYWSAQLETGDYHDSNADVAEGVVQQWMNSKGHRENILTDHWTREGIGVEAVDEEGNTAIYITQNFC